MALPACPSFEPPSIADRLRASLHRFSGPSSPLRPIRVATSAPRLVRQSVAQTAWHPRPRSSVRSLQPRAVRQALAPQAFRPFSQSRSLASQSTGLPSPISLASGVSAPMVCQADPEGPSPSVRLGAPGPGLLALGRASQPRPPPPNSRTILAGPLNILDSPAHSSPSVSSMSTARPVSPASVVRALPASPQTGPPGLAPRAPQPGRGTGLSVGLVLVLTLPSPVSHGIHAPTQWSGFQCRGLGLAPGLPASPPAPPGRWAASARCQR